MFKLNDLKISEFENLTIKKSILQSFNPSVLIKIPCVSVPVSDQEKAKEHSAQMRKMRNVCTHSCNSTEKFDGAITSNKIFGFDWNRWEQ
jgi:hypothetical protein